MRKTRNIKSPHMIIAESAHAAYWKASEYFGIKLSVIPVDSDYLLSPLDLRKNLRSSTILVIPFLCQFSSSWHICLISAVISRSSRRVNLFIYCHFHFTLLLTCIDWGLGCCISLWLSTWSDGSNRRNS